MERMNKLALIILLIPLLLTACVRELWPDRDTGSEGLVISFGSAPSPDVVVSTKGTLGVKQESQVKNMFIFIFDASGNKIYAHLFDESNKGEDKTYLPNYWYSSTTDTGVTSGKIFIKTQKKNGCKIVAICNINSEMINISPQYLSSLTKYSDVKALDLKLNQPVYSRNGYFPMSGEITGVDFDSDADVAVPTLVLTRLDAKINFIVRASTTKTPLDENGGVTGNIPVASGIYDFTPMSWQVINLPVGSYVFDRGDDVSGEYFNGPATAFETEVLTEETYCENTKRICEHGFSFYLMENRPAVSTTPSSPWDYACREERNGDGSFKYAPQTATYVILRGRLEVKEEGKSKVADVTYTIHLGDFTADFSDFSVLRNNAYTYRIFIEGVDQIRVSVEKESIIEPGAMGDILISEGEVMTCDSHYSTHALVFNKSKMDSEHMNWWVKTPFNPDGADPKSLNISGIDHKWVEFRVNVDKKTGGKYTTTAWTAYQSHGNGSVARENYKYIVDPGLAGNPFKDKAGNPISPTLYIDELMDFLAVESGAISVDGYTLSDDAFDGDGNIVVTAFVNENYYETNPITGQFEPDLWRRFVNQPMRTMCILSDVKGYGGSHVINSAFTIQQYSIQTVYNINSSDLNSAWGVEYWVDPREEKCNTKYWRNENKDSRPNTNADNGRKNSLMEWGLMDASYTNYSGGEWSTYLNQEGESENPLMKYTPESQSYAFVRHSCLSRNRDNNGDGEIDLDETRWYLASSNQLIDLYMGSYGIDAPADLYQRSPELRADRHTEDTKSVWREHVLASNRIVTDGANSNSTIRVVRAEEAIAGSRYERSNNRYFLSARCVRNLGYDPVTHKDITYSDENVSPDRLIIIKQYKNGVECPEEDWTDETSFKDVYFEVDCSRLNEKSIRYFTDTDLPKHDEHSDAACLYRRFRTTSINESISLSSDFHVKTMNETVDGGSNPYCPAGYRLPNIREIGIMCYYLDSNLGVAAADNYIRKKGNYTLARTYYSFGMEGDEKMNQQWGWAVGTDGEFKILMARTSHTTKSIRCVKDIKLE